MQLPKEAGALVTLGGGVTEDCDPLDIVADNQSSASAVPTCKGYLPSPQISSLCIERKTQMNLKNSMI